LQQDNDHEKSLSVGNFL